jgi:hypothetical protein
MGKDSFEVLMIRRQENMNPVPQVRHFIAAIVMVAGLGSAVAVYLAAGNAADDSVGYAVESGVIYQVDPNDTRTYRRNLELYGGKANVIVDDLRHFFKGLWHGKPLAFTIACVTVPVTLGFLFVTSPVPSEREPEEGDRYL